MKSLQFNKSSYSATSSECVEVALNVPGTVAVRDSKNVTGPVLRVAPAAWATFQSAITRDW